MFHYGWVGWKRSLYRDKLLLCTILSLKYNYNCKYTIKNIIINIICHCLSADIAMVVNILADVDKLLQRKYLNLHNMRWPWKWTHFILRKECFNCTYPTLSS